MTADGTDPFGGKYQDHGPFGRVRGTGAVDSAPDEFISGGLMAAGMFLLCASVLAPGLTAALVLLREVATKTGWAIPASSPSVAVNLAALGFLAVAGVVAALVCRHLARRRRTPAGIAALGAGAVLLVSGLWWVFAVNGLPL